MSIPAELITLMQHRQECARRRRQRSCKPHHPCSELRLQTGSPSQQLGARAETLALAHLQGNGLVLLGRNLRSHLGEIDLLMQEAGVLVAVEVRSRTCGRHLAFSITPAKCRRVALALQCRLGKVLERYPVRLDAVLVDWGQEPVRVTWWRNIWQASVNM
jgi:putative endonuclease